MRRPECVTCKCTHPIGFMTRWPSIWLCRVCRDSICAQLLALGVTMTIENPIIDELMDWDHPVPRGQTEFHYSDSNGFGKTFYVYSPSAPPESEDYFSKQLDIFDDL